MKILDKIKIFKKRIKSKNKQKVFCIGFNKTGTTSLGLALNRLGLEVGLQGPAEMLLWNWSEGDFSAIIEYSKNGQAFQDVPYSLPETYKHLDRAYPNSKFILTKRDSPEQWYTSLVKFHTKIWGKDILNNGEVAREINYRRPGFIYKYLKNVFKTEDENLYEKDALISAYLKHNQQVEDYFGGENKKILILNVSDPEAHISLSHFINNGNTLSKFPWNNKTAS